MTMFHLSAVQKHIKERHKAVCPFPDYPDEKATVVAAFALVAGFNVYNSQKAEGMMPDLVLADIEAKANTIGCETSYGSVLYYCIDWSVVTICTCGTSHPQHAKSYCPDKLCQ